MYSRIKRNISFHLHLFLLILLLLPAGIKAQTFVNIYGYLGTDEIPADIIPYDNDKLILIGQQNAEISILTVDLNGNKLNENTIALPNIRNILSMKVILSQDENYLYFLLTDYPTSCYTCRVVIVFKYNISNKSIIWLTSSNEYGQCFDIDLLDNQTLLITGSKRIASTGTKSLLYKVNSNNGNMIGDPTMSRFEDEGQRYSQDLATTTIYKDTLYSVGRFQFSPGGNANMRGALLKHNTDLAQIQVQKMYKNQTNVTPTNYNRQRMYPQSLYINNDYTYILSSGDWDDGTSNFLNFLSQHNRDDEFLFIKEYDFSEYNLERFPIMKNLNDGFIIVGSGSNQSDPSQKKDILLFKVDLNGNLLWSKKIETNGIANSPIQMIVAENNIYILGQINAFNTDYDLILIKTDANGDVASNCFITTENTPVTINNYTGDLFEVTPVLTTNFSSSLIATTPTPVNKVIIETSCCANKAGTIDLTPIEVCEGDSALIVKKEDHVLENEDVLEYMLHDGNLDTIGNILFRNKTGLFFYQPPLVFNHEYFAIAATGESLNDEVNLNDSCLSVTSGVSVVFREKPDFNLTLLSNDTLCSNDTLELSFSFSKGISPYSVDLGVDGVISGVTDGFILKINPSEVKNYHFDSVSDQYCTLLLDEDLDITISEKINITFNSKPANCTDTLIELNAVVNGGFGNYAYQWSYNGNSIINNTNQLLTSELGLYEIIVTDEFGCMTDNSINLISPPDFEIDLTVYSEICPDDGSGVILVDATYEAEYTLVSPINIPWQNSNVFQNLDFLPGENTYVIHARNSDGCLASDSIIIEGLQPIDWDLYPVNQTVCPNTMVNIAVLASGGNGDIRYYWNGNLDSNIVNFTPTETTTYQIIAYDKNNCPSTMIEAIITMPDNFDITFDNNLAPCGDSINLLEALVTGGFGDYSYQWFLEGNPISGANSKTLTTINSGNFSVSIQDKNDCLADSTIFVSPTLILNVLLTSIQEYCPDDTSGSIIVDTHFDAEYKMLSPSNTDWQNSNVFSNINFDTAQNTYVFQTRTFDGGCVGLDSITVNGLPEIAWDIYPMSQIVCPNTEAKLKAEVIGGNGEFDYYWNGVLDSNIIFVSAIQETNYNVIAYDNNNCPSSELQVTLTVPDTMQITADVIGESQICYRDTALLFTNTLGGTGNYTYLWSNEYTNDTSTDSIYSVTPDKTTKYFVTVSDTCETKISAGVEVKVTDQPSIDMTISEFEGCQPLTISFSNNTIGDYTAHWTFNELNANYTNAGTYTWLDHGNQTLQLILTDVFGCVYSDSSEIIVNPRATADFNFSSKKILNHILVEGITQNNSTFSNEYNWYIDAEPFSTEFEPILTFPKEYIEGYEVCLSVNNEFNCPSEFCKMIYIDDENQVYAANFFTPNSDNINESYYPVLSSRDVAYYEFLIFNRWGELIFVSSTPFEGWDGTYKGVKSPSDTYAWKLKVKFDREVQVNTYFGKVTLGR